MQRKGGLIEVMFRVEAKTVNLRYVQRKKIMNNKNINISLLIMFLMLILFPVKSYSQDLLVEHAPYGVPLCQVDMFKVRTAYLLCFNKPHRIPKWTMYHITKDYRNTPTRKNRFSSFRSDPDIKGEAKNSEYVGLFASHGYARGHFTPFGVLGGDRDGDGDYASLEDLSDSDEELTVFEGNYMSNIAPQHHFGFNGSPGLWWHLERWIQDDMVSKEGEEVHIIAGSILGAGDIEVVGTNNDIFVPPMFYKIVTFQKTQDKPMRTLAFMFSHQKIKHGRIQDFLTSVDIVEAMAGVDFFTETEIDEDIDTWHTWVEWFEGINSSHTK